MKKLFALLTILCLVSCSSTEDDIQKFIKTHPHPITCVNKETLLRDNTWTLTDANGIMFVSNPTNMVLPAVIK